MSRIERKAVKLRNQHHALSYEVALYGRKAYANRADANYRRAIHDMHEDPNSERYGKGYHEIEPPTHEEVYTETQDILDRALVYDDHQEMAQSKYDTNLQKAAAHVRRHLPKYIAMAQVDMNAQQESEKAVSEGAEEYLRQLSS